MKKLLIILLSVFLLGNTFAQGSLSGEVIVTNPKKAAVALNYEFDAGTIGSFSYDGEELSLKIGKQVFNNIGTSVGLGFKPTGERCFYVSLEDGIEMGALDVKGTGRFYGNSLKVSYNPSVKNEYCIHWISNTTFMVSPKKAKAQRMVVRPKVSTRMIPKLLLKNKTEIEQGVVLENENEEIIEAYCLDVDKNVPKKGTRFTYNNDSILDISMFGNDEFKDPFIIQSLVYSYMAGCSIGEDDIMYILKCDNASLLFFRQGFIIKCSNGILESSVPLPLNRIRASLNFEKLLQDKKSNRVYFNEKIDTELVQLMKQLLLMSGFENSKDGSLISPECDAEQAFESYSKYFTPLLLNTYSDIIKSMEEQ